MKIAVFTDVHGNLKALKSVLEQIKNKKADKTIFLVTKCISRIFYFQTLTRRIRSYNYQA